MQSSPAKGPAPPSSDVDIDSHWPSNDLHPQSNSSPSGSARHSTTPLILVHEEDDDDDRDIERPLIMEFSSSDEDNDDLDGSLSPLHQINGKLSIPPLSPFTIFIYLLSPYLKLGALLLPYFQLPFRYGLSSSLISAVLAVVARHLLYLLARYLRKGDLEDVVASAFISTKKHGKRRERRKEGRREFLKFSVRFGTATLRILVAAVYIRECVLFILPIVAPMTSLHQSSVELGLILAAITLGSSLSYPGSLASRLVVYVTGLSIFTYLLWLTTIMYLYTQGTLPVNPERLESRNIWDGIITTMFIFTSSNTLPLYASTKGTIQPLLFDTNTSLALPVSGTALPASRKDGGLKQPLYRSFKFLSLSSAFLAVALILPLVGSAAYPNENPRAPASMIRSLIYIEQSRSLHWPEDSSPATRIQCYITPALASFTLLFGIPQLLITIPTFPPGSFEWFQVGYRHSMPEVLSRILLFFKKSMVPLLLVALMFVTTSFELTTPVRLLTITLTTLATYFIPAILHVLVHTFKSPLSIVLPSTYFSSSFATTPIVRQSYRNLPAPGSNSGIDITSSFGLGNNDTQVVTSACPQTSSSSRVRHTNTQPENDDLLQRKERALQKRQMRRRIVWDIWAWAIFFGAFIIIGVRARML